LRCRDCPVSQISLKAGSGDHGKRYCPVKGCHVPAQKSQDCASAPRERGFEVWGRYAVSIVEGV
jgi:hypothetical protein